jgi:hypothetical protein
MNYKNTKQTNAHSRSLGPSQSRPRSKQHGSECLLTNGSGGHQLKVGARLDQERRDAAATGYGHPVHRAAHEAWSDKNGLSHGREHGIPLQTPTGVGLPSVTKPGGTDRLLGRSELEAAIKELTEFEEAVQKLCNKFEQPKRSEAELPSSVQPHRSVLPLESLFQPQSFRPSRNIDFVKGGNQGMSKAQLRRASRALKVKSGTLHGNPHFSYVQKHTFVTNRLIESNCRTRSYEKGRTTCRPGDASCGHPAG